MSWMIVFASLWNGTAATTIPQPYPTEQCVALAKALEARNDDAFPTRTFAICVAAAKSEETP